ncbi:MAG: hypothetical protein ACYTGG_13210, partial [Planctomycetota bacterium]
MRSHTCSPLLLAAAIVLTLVVMPGQAIQDAANAPTLEAAMDAAATWSTGQSRQPLIVIERAVVVSLRD